jgi:DNA-binding beta-propeller fold protein YncE
VVDRQGRILVGDRENNRIQLFDDTGKYLDQWPGFAPFGLALDKDGQLYVADGRAHKVLRLSDSGQVLATWGQKGTAAGEFELPHMLACDAGGNLLIAEVNGKRLQLLRRK